MKSKTVTLNCNSIFNNNFFFLKGSVQSVTTHTSREWTSLFIPKGFSG